MLQRATRVRPAEWILVAEMLGLLVKIVVLQERLSMPALMQRFDTPPSEAPRPAETSPQRLATLATALLTVLYRRDYCMKRSLLLFHYLRRWGHDVSIHFGVKKADGELSGHAWVQLDGRVFAEGSDPYATFTTTYAYPHQPSRQT